MYTQWMTEVSKTSPLQKESCFSRPASYSFHNTITDQERNALMTNVQEASPVNNGNMFDRWRASTHSHHFVKSMVRKIENKVQKNEVDRFLKSNVSPSQLQQQAWAFPPVPVAQNNKGVSTTNNYLSDFNLLQGAISPSVVLRDGLPSGYDVNKMPSFNHFGSFTANHNINHCDQLTGQFYHNMLQTYLASNSNTSFSPIHNSISRVGQKRRSLTTDDIKNFF